jgi:hypothetical protein
LLFRKTDLQIRTNAINLQFQVESSLIQTLVALWAPKKDFYLMKLNTLLAIGFSGIVIAQQVTVTVTETVCAATPTMTSGNINQDPNAVLSQLKELVNQMAQALA